MAETVEKTEQLQAGLHRRQATRPAPHNAPVDVQPQTTQVGQRARHAPSTLTPGDVLALQRTVGNQAMVELLSRDRPRDGRSADAPSIRVQRKVSKVQTKLTVGPAGDKYEEDADQVASQVMRMAASPRIRPAGQNLRCAIGPAALQRDMMGSGDFKTSTSTRRRGGYIKEVDSALKKYEKNKTPGTLTGLRALCWRSIWPPRAMAPMKRPPRPGSYWPR